MLSPLPTTVLNANTKLRMKLIKPCTDILTTQKLSINCNFFHQLILSYFIFFLFHVYVAKRSTTEREKLRTALSFLKIKIFLKIFVLTQNNISHLMSISALPHLDKFDRPVSLPPVRAIPETFMSGNDRSWLQSKRYISVKLRSYILRLSPCIVSADIRLSTCWWRRR